MAEVLLTLKFQGSQVKVTKARILFLEPAALAGDAEVQQDASEGTSKDEGQQADSKRRRVDVANQYFPGGTSSEEGEGD